MDTYGNINKLVHYDEELSGFVSKTTNQRLFKIAHENKENKLEDITYKFWKNDN